MSLPPVDPAPGDVDAVRPPVERPSAGRPATISDVAARAKVSRATVSRVVNGNAKVDREIAARVSIAIAELEYRPSTLARSLSLGTTQTIAVVVPDLENPMFQAVLRGVTRAAAAEGYRVLVADTEERVDDEADVAREARRRCDALVLCAPRMSERSLRALLPSLHPVVLVNRELLGADVPVVGIDYGSASAELTRHLLSLGHRHIAYLAGPEGSTSDLQRRRGIARALLEHHGETGETVEGVVEIPAGARIDDGHRVADEVVSNRCTAVLAFNDLVAFGALTRFRELGIGVPSEISVAGIDDSPLSRYAAPPLTTASVPQLDLGTEAWHRLRDAIGGVPMGHPVSFRPRLVIRESTGAVLEDGGVEARWRSAVITSVATSKTEESREPSPPAFPSSETLVIGETAVAGYASGQDLPSGHSPRPFLHPVTSLAGVLLSDVAPADHPHHCGVSLAVPDVDGSSYWGGRTFVRGQGSTELDNHGRQLRRSASLARGRLSEEIVWIDREGRPHLDESRSLAGARGLGEGWHLSWRSELRAVHRDITIGSPATNGRPGAGYGGLFWRFGLPEERAVFTADGDGEQNAHESSSPWLVVNQRLGDREVGVVLSQPGVPARPWFVRVAEYLGAGPMLAPVFSVVVRKGDRLVTALAAAIVDHPVASRSEAQRLARETETVTGA